MNKHHSFQTKSRYSYALTLVIFAFFSIQSQCSNLMAKHHPIVVTPTYPAQIKLTQAPTHPSEKEARSTEIAKKITELKKNNHFFQKNLFSKTTITNPEKYANYVTQAEWLKLHQNELKQLFIEAADFINIKIPRHNGTIISLDLMKMEILDPNFKVTTNKGKQIDLGNKSGVCYWGMIENEPQSMAAIAVYEDRITAMITDQTGTYELGPLEQEEATYVFYDTQDLLVRNQSDCSNEDKMLIQALPDTRTKSLNEAVCGRAISVYIEADYLSYQAMDHDVESVVVFITSFFNINALLYFNEQIPIQLSEIMVWEEDDMYAHQNSLLNTLYAFSDAKQDNFNGDLAHLVSVREGANSISGVAWINALCATYDPTDHSARTAYTQVFDNFNIFPSQSGTVSLFAHEMGHNCGSRHTHACVWGPDKNLALDNCMSSEGNCNNGIFPPSSGGSIMSYCYDIDYLAGFWEEPGNLIRTVYREAGCFRFGAEMLSLNDSPIHSGVHLATELIEAAGTVVESSFVRFISAHSISLEAGFEVELGADFEALIDDVDYCPELAFCDVPTIDCGGSTFGNHSSGLENWTNYCGQQAPDSPKMIYQFTTTSTGDVTVMTTSSNGSVAAILGACDNPNSCIAFTPNITVGSTNYVTAQNLAAGTYYVVVGGDTSGDFEVQLICGENVQEDDVDDRSSLVDDTVLALGIFPNPAKAVSLIQFQLLEDQQVSIDLYHFTGQLLKTIVSSSVLKKGPHQVPVSVSGLPSGSYFVVLDLGKKREVVKLLVQ